MLQREVKLYDMGFLLFLAVVAVVFIVHQKKEIRTKYEDVVIQERKAVSTYSDQKLIEKFYVVEAEIENYSDVLEGRYTVTKIGSSYFTAPSGGLKSYDIRKRLEALRKIRAIYKTEMYKRGLQQVPK